MMFDPATWFGRWTYSEGFYIS